MHPAEAAARVAAVGALLASRWPDEGQRPLLVGPSVHIQPDWIIDFVLALPAPLPLDVFTPFSVAFLRYAAVVPKARGRETEAGRWPLTNA